MLKDIPFKVVLKLIRSFRVSYFTVPWPDHAPAIHSDKNIENLLRDEYHFEGTYIGYNYKGEVMNLRSPWGRDANDKQLELHVRARPSPKDEYKYEYCAHLEKSRFEHPEEHLAEIGFSWKKGTAELINILDELNVNYERN